MKRSQTNISILQELYTSSLRLLSVNDIKEMYESISDEAIRFTGGKETRIILKSGKSLKTVYTSNIDGRDIKIRRKGFTTSAFDKDRVIVIDKQTINKSHPEFNDNDISSVLFVPLGFEKTIIGVLIIRFHQKVLLSRVQSHFLKLFGSMISLALQKTQALNETKEALYKRDLFIGMAAHELRTPLTSLGIYSEMIHNHLKKSAQPPLEWTEKVRHNIVLITKLVNELLQVKQIQRGRLKYIFEKCHLQEIIEAAIANFHFANPKRKIIFQNKTNKNADIVLGDFDKLLQVITNLLTNAAKFSAVRSNIIVKLDKTNEYIKFVVSDRGKGIPKKNIPYIFDEFYRGENNQEEGMGIGLYLTQKIIEKHKGKITVSSQEGVGTDITIIIPPLKNL